MLDSKLEAKFVNLPCFKLVKNKFAGAIDANGEEFNFCTDGYIERLELHVEIKSGWGNGVSNLENARKAIARQYSRWCFVNRLSHQTDDYWQQCQILEKHNKYDNIKHAWNHSRNKLEACSKHLGGNYLLVIDKPPTDSQWRSKLWKKHKLKAVSYKEFQLMLEVIDQNPLASKDDLYALIYERIGVLLSTTYRMH